MSNYGPTLLRRCSAFMAKRGLKLASNQIASIDPIRNNRRRQ